MGYDSDVKYAFNLYQKAIDAEGDLRQRYLKQAEDVLTNVPDGYPGKDDLLSKIRYMRY